MPVTTEPLFDAATVRGAVLLRSGELAITRGDVVRWAERFDPSYLARRRRRAALATLEDAVSDDDVEAAATEFRYDRDLESADTLVQWLAERGLTVDAWWEVVRRDVLEARFTGAPLPPEAGAGSDEDEDEAILADAALGDVLTEPAEALARRVAVACAVGVWGPEITVLPADAFGALDVAWRQWRSGVMTEPALRAAVDHERVGWLVLELAETRWPSVDAAREAVSCVRYDGQAIEAVARAARAPLTDTTCLLKDVPGVLHDALLSAVAGDVAGPFELPPHWLVVQVRAKHVPSLDEPLVRAAAERAVEAAAAAPLVARHITRPGA